ncbi:hypothetical protein L3X38_018189 [Prunus dulcis]|uniref:Integrase zinc-binding domain-containing protein n=1 Tax=Prunus dulcis TaxID=3755 RepID=A0AAD4Z9V3_PRUDU|nr:hypothetical protein L3X38_018189 [Prunus dulcis]
MKVSTVFSTPFSAISATIYVNQGMVLHPLDVLYPTLYMIRLEVENGTRTDYAVREDRALVTGTRLCVLKNEDLKREIMEEAHCSAYTMHSGSTKMYRTIREYYLWLHLKGDISRYCRTPICWNEVGERKLEKLESIQGTTEKVRVIKEKLKTAQDRHKSYSDNRSKDLDFAVGDWVFLKLSPWKGVMRFGKHGKLSPRYIRPYEITERIGPVAYKLALPPDLSRIHDVFHVSMLRKYIADLLISWNICP